MQSEEWRESGERYQRESLERGRERRREPERGRESRGIDLDR